MSSYWVRFAATGNPNGPNLPEWPAYDEQSRHAREFGSRTNVGPGAKAAPLFEAYLEYAAAAHEAVTTWCIDSIRSGGLPLIQAVPDLGHHHRSTLYRDGPDIGSGRCPPA